MILFICDTPFQIFNMLNLVNHYPNKFQTKNIDVFITDYSDQNYNLYIKLKEMNFFNHIYFIKAKIVTDKLINNRLVNYSRRIWNIVNYRKVLKKLNIPSDIKLYDEIYADLPDHILQIILKSQLPSVKISLFEDGTGSYSYLKQVHRRNFFKKMAHYLFFRNKFDRKLAGFYLYRPEFSSEGLGSVPIYQLPPVDRKDKESRNRYNHVFCFKQKYLNLLDKKFIFFDQPFSHPSVDHSALELFRNLVPLLPSESLHVKLHPRSNLDRYDSVNTKVYKDPVPFELIELNSRVEENVLISVFSTACLNPKIIFNEEPVVILLFKLIDFSPLIYINEFSFELAYKVKESYSRPDLFFIPESFEELKQIVDYVKKSS